MAKKLPPVHPGEVLREEFLRPLNLSPYAVARAVGCSDTAVAHALSGASLGGRREFSEAELIPEPDRAPAGEHADGKRSADRRRAELVMRVGVARLGELLVETSLQSSELSGELCVRDQHFAEPQEGAHDVNTHLDGLRAVQHVGRLNGAVLCESEG